MSQSFSTYLLTVLLWTVAANATEPRTGGAAGTGVGGPILGQTSRYPGPPPGVAELNQCPARYFADAGGKGSTKAILLALDDVAGITMILKERVKTHRLNPKTE